MIAPVRAFDRAWGKYDRLMVRAAQDWGQQEIAVRGFLLQAGAAIKVNRIEEMSIRVGELLGTKKLAAMAKAARAVGHPTAARNVCDEVLRRIAS